MLTSLYSLFYVTGAAGFYNEDEPQECSMEGDHNFVM